jgi:hypothetical protein
MEAFRRKGRMSELMDEMFDLLLQPGIIEWTRKIILMA